MTTSEGVSLTSNPHGAAPDATTMSPEVIETRLRLLSDAIAACTGGAVVSDHGNLVIASCLHLHICAATGCNTSTSKAAIVDGVRRAD